MAQQHVTNDPGWTVVHRKEQEHFELRAQDWDCPIVQHDTVGKKLDELPPGTSLRAVIMAPKGELLKVTTILKGTTRPYRVMLIELSPEGDQRIPSRVGNLLRFRQAKANPTS